MEYEPLTVGVTARWDRTRYELLDRRAQVLAMFDAENTLASFSTHHNHLRVETVDGATVTLDLERVDTYAYLAAQSTSFVTKVGEVLDAQSVEVLVSFQFVIGWEGETNPVEAAQAGVNRLMPGLADTYASDCAVLLDGTSDSWNYQVEFGVISAAEAGDRLSRRVGRRAGAGVQFSTRAGAEQFPAVSTFIDCSWFKPDTFIPLSEVDDAVEEARRGAEVLAYRLHSRLRGSDL
ncbi:hypothetical protein [Gordonia terrae]|uniref:hypothetical protein n=1 Tax=Gordonia terrae TaxID=2055 RepID=UPI001269352F|nr:hypothetical protein [Gordonia terrae]